MSETIDKDERIEHLERLVDELMKDIPDESYVKKMMTQMEIPYTKDPMQRINSVLVALHPTVSKKASSQTTHV